MNKESINLNISFGTIVKVVVVLVLAYLLYSFRDLALVLLTSIVLASAIEPITAWFVKFRIPRVLAVIITYLFFFAGFFSLVFLFLPAVFNDLADLTTAIPGAIKSLDVLGYLPDVPTQYLDSLKTVSIDAFLFDNLLPGLGDALVGTSAGLLGTAKLLLFGLFNLVLTIIFSFYLAVQEDGVANFLRLVTYGRNEKYIIDLWKRTRKKMGLWLQGQLFLAFLIGLFVFLGLSILGFKNALGLAVLAAVFELIPIFGPILAAVPAIAIGFASGPALGFMVAGFYIIIQQFESHLIHPLVVTKIVGVPPLLVILSLIIGAQLAGLWGIVLSVPVAAAFMEFINDLEQKRKIFEQENDCK